MALQGRHDSFVIDDFGSSFTWPPDVMFNECGALMNEREADPSYRFV